ncbi:MAG: hypothetical protein FWB74_03260 [Defluviitaleaceae bacterium]|nr:hypothetical protein [Defluviitaleaceae bacterium]
MALTVIKQGDNIRAAGDAFDAIFFVVKGVCEAEFLGKKLNFKQGDTVGLCGAASGQYAMTYVAYTEVTVFVFECTNFAQASEFLKGNTDLMSKVVTSVFMQTTLMLKIRGDKEAEAKLAYDTLHTAYPEYERLCGLYSFTAKKLDGYDKITKAGADDVVEFWLPSYYPEYLSLPSGIRKEIFSNIGIAVGFLNIGVTHLRDIMQSAEVYRNYLVDISKLFLNSSEHDILALVTELYAGSVNIKGASENIGALKEKVKYTLQRLTGVDRGLLKQRLALEDDDAAANGQAVVEVGDAGSGAVKSNLKDALYTILEYSELEEEERNKFARSVHDFTQVRDRSSTDDDVFKLRRELTRDFYTIYTSVFLKSLKEQKVPTIIKMFLNFGFMDVALAGADNADYLFSIADSYKGAPDQGIYTIMEWLTAIYEGKVEPSQGDLDTNYQTHVKEQVQSMRLASAEAEKEEKKLLADKMGKLKFELEAVFPVGNKITFGRVSSYCPLFGDHNVQRSLDKALVTPATLKENLDAILELDFSAFHREVQYSNPEVGINTTQTRKAQMPNFILMPNVGTRGVMWQEIEGRNRQTPCRMFLPAFFLEDLKVALMRLVAEFRWEMTKRIQGGRWSDPASPSLTSEYFTYLQFYRGNRDLSVDAKGSVKTELMRARNVFRAVFVNNYIEWLTYEANGSQRLNKVARKIMFMYCPFPKELREKLGTSPQYAESLKPFDIANRQEIQKLTNLMQRVSKTGKPMPQELTDEMEFLQL